MLKWLCEFCPWGSCAHNERASMKNKNKFEIAIFFNFTIAILEIMC